MATCNDIDQSLASLKASNDAKFAALEAKITECCAKTDIATNLANQAIALAQLAQQSIATVANQVIGLLATVATIISLSGRVDALESGLNATNNGLSQAFTLIGQVRDNARAELKAEIDRLTASLYALEAVLTGNLNRAVALLQKMIEECCKRIDDFLDPNNPNSPNNPMQQQCCNDIKNAISALSSKIDNMPANSEIVNQSLVGLAPKLFEIGKNILDILSIINTITSAISGIVSATNALKSIADAIAKFLGIGGDQGSDNPLNPPILGNLGAKDCTGTLISIPYGGRGVLGLQSMLTALTVLIDGLNTSNCTNKNPQGFVNTNVCGQPFTGTFKGDIEGIQRLGDLIGFGLSIICKKQDNTDDIIDNPVNWKPRLNPYMKEILDEYFPPISGSLAGTLCNGTTTSVGYYGTGLNGLNAAIKSKAVLDDRVMKDLLVCISTLLETETKRFNGAFVGVDCDGQSINAGYSNGTVETMLQALFFALSKQTKSLCDTTSDRYTGDFVALDCDGRSVNHGFFQARTDQVLLQMFKALSVKIDSLCPVLNDSLSLLDCSGNLITGNYGGQGVKGLEKALKAYTLMTGMLIKDTCQTLGDRIDKIDPKNPVNDPQVVTDLTVVVCGKLYRIPYQSSESNLGVATTKALSLILGEILSDFCEKIDLIDPTNPVSPCNPNNPNNPENESVSGSLNISACGVNNQFNYSTNRKNEPRALTSGLLFLLQNVLDKMCQKVDSLDKTNPVNNPNVSGQLSVTACGVTLTYPYGVPESALAPTITKGALELIGRLIDRLCQKLDVDPITAGNVTIDVCGTPVTGSYSGKKSDLSQLFPVMQTQMMGQALTVICEKMEEMDCTPAIIMPTDKYIERDVTSQATIWYYPVGTTKSQRKDSPKWYMTIANPRAGLTCADFAPLTWQRGPWRSQVLFAMGAIETVSYFVDYDGENNTGEAVDKMLYAASLSTIPLARPQPRVTKSNGDKQNLPSQPIMEVVRVIFVEFDANGQKTNVQCLQCVP